MLSWFPHLRGGPAISQWVDAHWHVTSQNLLPVSVHMDQGKATPKQDYVTRSQVIWLFGRVNGRENQYCFSQLGYMYFFMGLTQRQPAGSLNQMRLLHSQMVKASNIQKSVPKQKTIQYTSIRTLTQASVIIPTLPWERSCCLGRVSIVEADNTQGKLHFTRAPADSA